VSVIGMFRQFDDCLSNRGSDNFRCTDQLGPTRGHNGVCRYKSVFSSIASPAMLFSECPGAVCWITGASTRSPLRGDATTT
jgi:hypothetical protein